MDKKTFVTFEQYKKQALKQPETKEQAEEKKEYYKSKAMAIKAKHQASKKGGN